MLCPICNSDTRVIDSRFKDSRIRRRRKCLSCGYRYSTYEVIKPNKNMLKLITDVAVDHFFKGKQKFTVPEMVALKSVTEFGYKIIEAHTGGKIL